MKCESCGKNEAKFHFTKIYNGEVEEKHLCESCASKDFDFDFGSDNHFSMNEFIAGLIGGPVKSYKEENGLQCTKCGQSYSEFKEDGRFGCDECYIAFKDKLNPLIKGLHGKNHHSGKMPKHSSQDIFLKREVDDLKKELEESVKQERFEKAAILRDRLKDISMKLEDIKG